MISIGGFGTKSISEQNWRKWQQAYPSIVSSLVFIYRDTGRGENAEEILDDWLKRNPNDKSAEKLLKEIRSPG